MPALCRTGIFILLSCLNNFSSLDAAGADINFSDTALFDYGTYPLKVRIKSSLIQIMRMADIVSNQRFFPAYSTLF